MRIVWQGEERPALYEAGSWFAQEALVRDSSMFTPPRAVWTTAVLDDLHRRFVLEADWGEGTFESKTPSQLEGASDEVVQLLGELVFVNLLAAADITPGTKRERVDFVLQLMDDPVAIPDELQPAFDVGIAGIGAGKQQRYWQLVFLIEFARRWKQLPEPEQQRLLQDPWAFRSFAADQEAFKAPLQREALLHLLFPDEFEAVLSVPHKKRIVKTFEDLLSEPTDNLDRALLQLRGSLAERFGADFHFYEPAIRELWHPGKASPWDQLARWARRVFDSSEFDAKERDYKLEFARDLGHVRENLRTGEDWAAELSKAIRSTNLLNWRQWEQLDEWTGADPGRARESLEDLWDPSSPLVDRITRLGHALKPVISGQGTRVAVASVLLMGLDARAHPPYRPEAFKNFRTLVDYPGPDMPCEDGDRYAHALGLFDRVVDELASRDVRLRDRLDAQSVLWTLAQDKVELFGTAWTEDEREAFLRWRGDLPRLEDALEDEVDGPSSGEGLADPLAAAAAQLLLPRAFLARIKRLLTDRQQILFYGPPGTGKTYVARAFANAVSGDPSRVQLVQFHPSYSYEDFVEGFRPDPQAGGAGFALVDGPLKQIAKRAAADRNHVYVLIIDELNRSNVAKVFGELYFLLEYRDEQVTLQYSHEPFGLPTNLWLIGTMNTADRSIALMDTALRRRFYFQAFLPDQPPISRLLGKWLARHSPDMRWVADVLDRVNQQIDDPHFAVGPSYFLRKDLTTDWVETIWEHAILPYLEEQFFGEEERLEWFRLTELRDDIDEDSAPEDAIDDTFDEETGEASADADPA